MAAPTINIRALIAAVISRAIDDLKGIGYLCRRPDADRAIAFVLSETCEAYCSCLGIDYEAVREKADGLYQRFIEKDAPRKAGEKKSLTPEARRKISEAMKRRVVTPETRRKLSEAQKRKWERAKQAATQ